MWNIHISTTLLLISIRCTFINVLLLINIKYTTLLLAISYKPCRKSSPLAKRFPNFFKHCILKCISTVEDKIRLYRTMRHTFVPLFHRIFAFFNENFQFSSVSRFSVKTIAFDETKTLPCPWYTVQRISIFHFLGDLQNFLQMRQRSITYSP